MAETVTVSKGGSSSISGKEEADKNLRHVENDVIVTDMVRKKAHEVCFEPYVREFEECVRGKMVSMVWKCRAQNKAMQNCLKELYSSEEFHDECREEYLQQRDEFRRTNVTRKKRRKQYFGE